MLNLYTDTNGYLTFYHLTSDDLEELKKLKVLTGKSKKIKLYLPEQTRDEFDRNREVKIADALKRFKEEKLTNQFPQICKQYPEYDNMRKAIKEFDFNKSKLLDQLLRDIFDKELAADNIIDDLFDNADEVETTPELVAKAKLRFDLGRPPGKNKSYGDALNWETLLECVPEGEDIYFVSDDKDYYSEIDPNRFNDYLIDEWVEKKKSTIYHYRQMSAFFKDKFPGIKIISEYEKDTAIQSLQNSGSFSSTHRYINDLKKFGDFTDDQLDAIATAYITNPQVSSIRGDVDVKSYAQKVIFRNRSRIDEGLMAQLDELFAD